MSHAAQAIEAVDCAVDGDGELGRGFAGNTLDLGEDEDGAWMWWWSNC